MGQFYWELTCKSGLTMRQLGEMRRKDPEQYMFIESAYTEEVRRNNEAVERANSQ
jgi:hypothetical protein